MTLDEVADQIACRIVELYSTRDESYTVIDFAAIAPDIREKVVPLLVKKLGVCKPNLAAKCLLQTDYASEIQLVNLAKSCADMNYFQEAMQLYEKAQRAEYGTVYIREAAQNRMVSANFEQALKAFSAIKDKECCIRVGQAFERQEKYYSAAKAYLEADSPEDLVKLGDLMMERQTSLKYERLWSALEIAGAAFTFAKNPVKLEELAQKYMMLNEWYRAHSYYVQAASFAGPDDDRYSKMAKFLERIMS